MWWVFRLVTWICRLISKSIYLWVFLTQYALKFIWERCCFNRIGKMGTIWCKSSPDEDNSGGNNYERIRPAIPQGARFRTAEIPTSSKSITGIDTKRSKPHEKKSFQTQRINSANTSIHNRKNKKSARKQQSNLCDAATLPQKPKCSKEANQIRLEKESDKQKLPSLQKEDRKDDSTNFQNSTRNDSKGKTSKERNQHYEKSQPKLSQDLEQRNDQKIKQVQVHSCSSYKAINSDSPSSYNAGNKTNSQGNDSLPPSKVANVKMLEAKTDKGIPAKSYAESLYKTVPHKEKGNHDVQKELEDTSENKEVQTRDDNTTFTNHGDHGTKTHGEEHSATKGIYESLNDNKSRQEPLNETELASAELPSQQNDGKHNVQNGFEDTSGNKEVQTRDDNKTFTNHGEHGTKTHGEVDSATKGIDKSLNDNKSRQEPLNEAELASAELPSQQNDGKHDVQNVLEDTSENKEVQTRDDNTTLTNHGEHGTKTHGEEHSAAKGIDESLNYNKSRQEPLNETELASAELPSQQNYGKHNEQNELKDTSENNEVQTRDDNTTFINHGEHERKTHGEEDSEAKGIDESLNDNKSRQEPLNKAELASAELPSQQNDGKHNVQNGLEDTSENKGVQTSEDNTTFTNHGEHGTKTHGEEDSATKGIDESLNDNQSIQKSPNGAKAAYAMQNDNDYNVQTELEDTMESKEQNGKENTTCRNNWEKDQAVDNTAEVGQIKTEISWKSWLPAPLQQLLQKKPKENTDGDSDTVLDPENIEQPSTELHRSQVLHELDEIKQKAWTFCDEIDNFTELEHSNKHYYIEESLRRLTYRLDDMYDEVDNDESVREEMKKVYKIIFSLFGKLDDKTDQNRMKQENEQEQDTVLD